MHSEGAMKIGSSILHYHVKHFEEGSRYGIEGGRISKLSIIQDGEIAAEYDRGWNMEPETEEAKAVLAILMEEYN